MTEKAFLGYETTTITRLAKQHLGHTLICIHVVYKYQTVPANQVGGS